MSGQIWGIVSDLHLHGWSAFSSVNEDGINSRLAMQLEELRRAAREVKEAGGDTLVVAGDVFHVRGSLAPSVLNPVMDTFRDLHDAEHMKIIIIPGNHDLEGKGSDRVSSAITALEGVGCMVQHGPIALGHRTFVPWIANVEELKSCLEALRIEEDKDLIIHAPIDGVIKGLPNCGLSPEYLSGLGFNRVFAGHYHNHKDFNNGVYSIGALGHQTWSDIGTKAGFLLVDDESVTWRKSHAPAFVEIHADTSVEDVPLIVDGNYIRVKTNTHKASEVAGLRAWLLECGAAGVIIQSVKESKDVRAATIKSGLTLEASVAEYISTGGFENGELLKANCARLLGEAVEL